MIYKDSYIYRNNELDQTTSEWNNGLDLTHLSYGHVSGMAMRNDVHIGLYVHHQRLTVWFRPAVKHGTETLPSYLYIDVYVHELKYVCKLIIVRVYNISLNMWSMNTMLWICTCRSEFVLAFTSMCKHANFSKTAISMTLFLSNILITDVFGITSWKAVTQSIFGKYSWYIIYSLSCFGLG